MKLFICTTLLAVASFLARTAIALTSSAHDHSGPGATAVQRSSLEHRYHADPSKR